MMAIRSHDSFLQFAFVGLLGLAMVCGAPFVGATFGPDHTLTTSHIALIIDRFRSAHNMDSARHCCGLTPFRTAILTVHHYHYRTLLDRRRDVVRAEPH